MKVMSKKPLKTNREAKERQAHPSPLGDCVVIGKETRHSGESRNPVAVLLNNSIFLDARFRGHDEL
jgi:hypothetical protein